MLDLRNRILGPRFRSVRTRLTRRTRIVARFSLFAAFTTTTAATAPLATTATFAVFAIARGDRLPLVDRRYYLIGDDRLLLMHLGFTWWPLLLAFAAAIRLVALAILRGFAIAPLLWRLPTARLLL